MQGTVIINLLLGIVINSLEKVGGALMGHCLVLWMQGCSFWA